MAQSKRISDIRSRIAVGFKLILKVRFGERCFLTIFNVPKQIGSQYEKMLEKCWTQSIKKKQNYCLLPFYIQRKIYATEIKENE